MKWCPDCESAWEDLPPGVDECPECFAELTELPEDYKTDAEIYEKENPR